MRLTWEETACEQASQRAHNSDAAVFVKWNPRHVEFEAQILAHMSLDLTAEVSVHVILVWPFDMKCDCEMPLVKTGEIMYTL